MKTTLTARITPHHAYMTAALTLTLGAWWGVRHIHHTMALADGVSHRFGLIYTFAFLVLAWQTITAFSERPYTVDLDQAAELARLNVCVQVPVYNEDPDALRACIDSLFTQTRLPQTVSIVDDGSRVNYAKIETWARAKAAGAGVTLTWHRQDNAGKRHAQAHTFASTPDADIYLTVDSDTILDRHAISEGLKPLADQRVMSVAGIVLSANASASIVSRIADLWYCTAQLTGRSSMSTMGAVLVNSGPIAFYRAWIIRDALDSYTRETFFGTPVGFSDDSMLTLHAIMNGRTVQQPSAFAFAFMPETLDHHIRQYTRWMRGSFIRSWWRFKYLPLTGYAYWAHLLVWTQYLLGIVIFAALFVIQPVIDPAAVPYYLIVPILIGYAQGLRYLAVTRSDMTRPQQIGIYALTPIAVLWSFFGLRAVRWAAIATCLKTGWGTRETVEVRMNSTTAPTLVGPLPTPPYGLHMLDHILSTTPIEQKPSATRERR